MRSPVVVVTGASRGIGLALTEKFKKENWLIAGCAKSQTSSPYCDLSFACDVTDEAQVRAFAQATQKKFGQIDVLINNAGLAGTTDMNPESPSDSWHSVLNTNLTSVFLMAKHFGPLLREQTGRIISIASVLGLKGVPDQPAYCAAKHGVIGLTRSLAHYYAPKRITVNAICPGWVRTDMAQLRMTELNLSETELKNGVPLGRFIEPHEVAEFAFFLSSPSASMISGQALAIDGGVLT